jgi:glycosyltransferase involved in cell wall biosynthesis
MITIITPTYNRRYCLNNAYVSLLGQTQKDFEWIIVDDGSRDNTSELVDSWLRENKIQIKYISKENGGKHTALNVGFVEAKGELVLILDSDDYLTDDALEIVIRHWQGIKYNQSVGGLHFLKGYQTTGKCIGKMFANNYEVASSIKVHYHDQISGDKCKIYRTEILQKNLFPIFGEERVLGETTLWNKLARNYMLLNINVVIYLFEYLPDGLTANNRKNGWQNPKGAAAGANERVTSEFPLAIRLRSIITFVSRLLGIEPWHKIIARSNCRWLCLLLFPLGLTWYIIRKIRLA